MLGGFLANGIHGKLFSLSTSDGCLFCPCYRCCRQIEIYYGFYPSLKQYKYFYNSTNIAIDFWLRKPTQYQALYEIGVLWVGMKYLLRVAAPLLRKNNNSTLIKNFLRPKSLISGSFKAIWTTRIHGVSFESLN